jgi:hypothetical protein
MSADNKPKKIVKIFTEVFGDNYVTIEYLLDDTQTVQQRFLHATLKEAQAAYKDARLEYLRGKYGDYIDEYLELTQDEKKN